MMDMEKFVEEVLAAVKEKAVGAFKAKIITTTKNNGVILTGITGAAEGRNISPCIYLNDYYKEYKSGWIGVNEAAENVYLKILEHGNDLKGIDMDDITKWERIRPRIHAKLINMERNKEMLAGMPWKRFLDLAEVYYVKMDGIIDGGNASFLVNNSHMEMWGQDEESIHQTALSNMHKDGGPLFESMETVIRKIMADDELPFTSGMPDADMYVLSNRDRLLGAAEILDSSTLEMVSSELEGDFIVLPSSIHESVIIPADAGISYQELAVMVYEINRTQVDVEERLSDHVYLYERDKGTLKITA